MGYSVVSMWECDWEREKKRNEAIRNFIERYGLSTPLNPRDALYGGRTNCTTLYRKCGVGERMDYIDVVS